jgi:hypothetical protein
MTLTTFKIVAVADSGTSLFSTGRASITATQDLQIINGLPPALCARATNSARSRYATRQGGDEGRGVAAPGLLELKLTVTFPLAEA